MTTEYDHKGFWIKAKLFLNRAMDDDATRSFDEQAMWASMALELLAKGALARLSPLLIAEPNEEGTNLLAATGLSENEAVFMSVRAKTVYVRCSRAFKPFSSVEALKITKARNVYIHGTGVGFTNIPTSVWWPRFWAQAAILVEAQDETLGSLLGNRAVTAEAHLEENAKNVEFRVESLLNRARQRVSERDSGNAPARLARRPLSAFALTAGLAHDGEAACPACGAMGIIEGEDSEIVDRRGEPDPDGRYDVYVTYRVFSDYFSCSYCELVLDRYELVEHAGLPDSFEYEGEEPYEEPEYGND